MEVLKLENVCKSIGKKPIVKNLNLEVDEGGKNSVEIYISRV